MKIFKYVLALLVFLVMSLAAVACDDSSNSPSSDEIQETDKDSSFSSSSRGSGKNSSSSKIEMRDAESIYDESTNTLIDGRDGHVYRTVKIGDQIWMAENLNYAYLQPTLNVDSSSFCYADGDSTCEKFGRLYYWSAAMDSAGIFSKNGKGCGYNNICSPIYPVRGVCPKGWHLPMSAEWNILTTTAYGSEPSFYSGSVSNDAGCSLKSTTSWEVVHEYDSGTDDFGFSALSVDGGYARFWSSIDGGGLFAHNFYLKFYACSASESYISKKDEYSVRCIKDDESSENSTKNVKSVEPVDAVPQPVKLSEPCKSDSSDTCKYGTLIDSRDGKTYKTVSIGVYTWMAENLNYETENSKCPDEGVDCLKAGQYYLWSDAIDSAGRFSSNSKGCGSGKICMPAYPIRGVCPEGWHLPQFAEWEMLLECTALGNTGDNFKSSTDWNGYDYYGFSVIPSEIDSSARKNKEHAYFWSSTEFGSNLASSISVKSESSWDRTDDFVLFGDSKTRYKSVRCVNDTLAKTFSKQSMDYWSWDVPKEKRQNPDIAYETMKDSRDGKVYKTVKIGDRVWMAENLNYEMHPVYATEAPISWCPYNKEERCAVAGRFYKVKALANACPEKWHLPTKEDWLALHEIIGSSGDKLKSTIGWGAESNGTDDFGFSAIPVGGSSQGNDYFYGAGELAIFWLAQEDGKFGSFSLLSDRSEISFSSNDDSHASSVRCIKD